MACRMFGAKPLAEPMLTLDPNYKLQWNYKQNTKIIFQGNVFKNVYKISDILTWPQYVKNQTITETS